ncbi:MAG TPA: aminoglycoside 6'-N-acetyltransferase [Gemmatimonadales bacterium]
MTVREATAADAECWGALRCELWPGEPGAELMDEAREFFRGGAPGNEVVLLAEREGQVVGFAEVGMRAYAEGCVTSPVGYLEGWYVEPGHRGTGVGRALVDAAIAWARARGLSEFASDALYDNDASRAAHRALGFEEVEAIRCFRKEITGTA